MSEDNAEPKQKRKASGDNVTTLRTENMTSGEVLRAAREKRKLTLEDVSAAIHVRAAQLRAIEEGNIDALPGMTYAVGFVKSYASYLKLNPIDLGNKFKSEHGALKPLMPDLPEIKPVVESRMPDPRIVGVAAFFAVVVLLGWTFFGSDDTAGELDIAPVVVAENGEGEVAVEIAPENVTEAVAGKQDEVVETAGSPEDSSAADDEAKEAVAAKAEEKKAEAAKAEEKKEEVKAEEKAKAEEKETVAETTPEASVAEEEATEEVAAIDEEAAKKKAAAEAVANAAVQAEVAEEPITIRKAGRVVLKARQTSWLQVSDANERVVFKKLLHAGEQYTVPEGRGYTLITTNAGGFDVIVDGKQAPALGKAGEILRGLPLEPAELTRIRRAKSRINN